MKPWKALTVFIYWELHADCFRKLTIMYRATEQLFFLTLPWFVVCYENSCKSVTEIFLSEDRIHYQITRRSIVHHMEYYTVDTCRASLVDYHVHSLSAAVGSKESWSEDIKHAWNAHASNACCHKALLFAWKMLLSLRPRVCQIFSSYCWRNNSAENLHSAYTYW